MTSRVLRAVFAVYVVATLVHIGYVVAHEPFAFDAWNVAELTGAKPITPSRFFDFWWTEYTHSNPRLGQALTYLTYKLDGFAEIATPLAFLAISLAVTVLGLRRWPRAGRDLALWAIGLGFLWFALPELGRNMFNRAYSANYIYGAAIQLWFLVPLRLAKTYEVRTKTCLAYAGFGLVAGLCNEHTGPALTAFLLGYAWWKRAERPRLVWAGGLGFAIGFAALFFAPGQGERYDSLVAKTSLPMRLVQRGAIGNLDILRDYLVYAAPLLALVVIVLAVARDRPVALRGVLLALAIGLALTVTLFVSPKLGSRFYIVSLAVLLAACLGLVDAVLVEPRRLIPLVLVAVAASIYAAGRSVPLYTRVAEQGNARIAMLEASAPGDAVVADAFEQVDESWWFIGDDFRDQRKRDLVARYFALARVYYRGDDQRAPLGMAGVTLVPRYWVRGEPGSAVGGDFDATGTRAIDLAGFAASLDLLRREVAPRVIERFELEVDFVGTRPALPRPKLLLARALGDRLEGHTGAIVRRGASITREVVFDSAKPFELYIYQVGGEFRRLGPSREFTPWRTGIFWALACDASECWVIATARSHAA
ncbi:MAG: DUF6056 family protein [Kofleriaceae bacterium]